MSTHRPHYSEKNLSTEKGLQENVFFLFILESEDLKLQLNMPRLLRFLASRWLSIFFFFSQSQDAVQCTEFSTG